MSFSLSSGVLLVDTSIPCSVLKCLRADSMSALIIFEQILHSKHLSWCDSTMCVGPPTSLKGFRQK
jgi:hypothetical protein